MVGEKPNKLVWIEKKGPQSLKVFTAHIPIPKFPAGKVVEKMRQWLADNCNGGYCFTEQSQPLELSFRSKHDMSAFKTVFGEHFKD